MPAVRIGQEHSLSDPAFFLTFMGINDLIHLVAITDCLLTNRYSFETAK